jgi:hypothetical protein
VGIYAIRPQSRANSQLLGVVVAQRGEAAATREGDNRLTLHLEENTMRALKGWCVAAAMVAVFALVSVSTPDVRPSFAQGSAFERSLEALTLSRQGTRVLGIVQGGQFSAIYPETMTRRQLRLTTVRSMEAKVPEQGALDLSSYEGSLIMVQGIDKGRWLYEATVIDQASPIMVAVLSELFAGARLRRLQ